MTQSSGVLGAAAVPTARRLHPPSWRDPRLLIGLLLVLVSVAAGARALAVADRTVPVYAARVTLPAGTALDASSVSVSRVRLTGTPARYLDAASPLPPDLVVQRTVGVGELIPLAALSTATDLATRPVTIPVDGAPPAGIAPGGRVDVWVAASARAPARTAASAPRAIVTAVEVFHVNDGTGTGLSARGEVAVQLLIPQEQLPAVLAALAAGDVISLLPVPGSAG